MLQYWGVWYVVFKQGDLWMAVYVFYR